MRRCGCVVESPQAPSADELTEGAMGRAQATGSGGFKGMHRSIAGFELLVATDPDHIEAGLDFLEVCSLNP